MNRLQGDEIMMLDFNDYCRKLLAAGFSMTGGNDEGVFGLLHFNWKNEPLDSPIHTDLWEWRVRVLEERDDIAYGKAFFRKGGFITRKWYPNFLAARRKGLGFTDFYADGLVSNYAKRVYDTLSENGALPAHEIQALAEFSKNEKSKFEKAVTDLQMGLFITMCGQAQKRNKSGEEYGWPSMMLCLTEQFWGSDVFEEAAKISAEQAEASITAQVLKLNPDANQKKIKKFIYG
jgi:hypothetical protein